MQKNRFSHSFGSLIWNQFKEFKIYYFLGVIALVCTHFIQSQLPFMAKEIAEIVGQSEIQLSPWPFFFCAFGIIIFRTASRVFFFYPARLLQKYLRSELLNKLESNSPQRFRHLSSGQLFQYLTGDVDQIRALIGFVGLQGANFIIVFVILIPKIIEFHAGLLVALIPLLVAFLIFTFVVMKNRKYFKLMQDTQGDVQNIIMESYVGKKTIKNFHAEDSFIKLFREVSLKELYYFYRSGLGISFTLPLIALGIGLSMLWGAYIIKANELGASTLILFSGFIFLFMEPLGYLTWIGVVISRTQASWVRLQDLDLTLSSEIEIEEKLKTLNENANLKDDRKTMHIPYWENSLSFEFKPGAWNIIVAQTGHGKSELLFKIAEVLRMKKIEISLVAQDPYLYNDTVERNIFLGRSPSVEERETAKHALKIFGLDYIDSDLERLMSLEVGENGKRLSGGQAKRLCLIRSLMSQAQVLIWDDPFSSVDLILEKEIILTLKKLPAIQEKTIVLTGHRLSTVKHSDYIVFIDKNDGLVESGGAELLTNSNSKTYEYFQQQMV